MNRASQLASEDRSSKLDQAAGAVIDEIGSADTLDRSIFSRSFPLLRPFRSHRERPPLFVRSLVFAVTKRARPVTPRVLGADWRPNPDVFLNSCISRVDTFITIVSAVESRNLVDRILIQRVYNVFVQKISRWRLSSILVENALVEKGFELVMVARVTCVTTQRVLKGSCNYANLSSWTGISWQLPV